MNPPPSRRSPWVLVPRPNATARVRLVCLPHAGGGASTFFAWGAALQTAAIEVRSVQYPGRESRFAEPALQETGAMVRALADVWAESAGGPCTALYGHSMGALLGFELALELRRRGVSNAPVHLFLSGHQAAHLPYRAPRVHQLPDAEFLPAVSAQFGGIPNELLDDPDVAEVIRSTLRADFTLVENYQWREAGKVDVPITALGGTQDPWTTEAELRAWAMHTTGRFDAQMLPGDHFFNLSARAAVLAIITSALSAY